MVTGGGNDVTELRTIHDWVVKPKMKTVPGAAEINSWGGFVPPVSLTQHSRQSTQRT